MNRCHYLTLTLCPSLFYIFHSLEAQRTKLAPGCREVRYDDLQGLLLAALLFSSWTVMGLYRGEKLFKFVTFLLDYSWHAKNQSTQIFYTKILHLDQQSRSTGCPKNARLEEGNSAYKWTYFWDTWYVQRGIEVFIWFSFLDEFTKLKQTRGLPFWKLTFVLKLVS